MKTTIYMAVLAAFLLNFGSFGFNHVDVADLPSQHTQSSIYLADLPSQHART
ncbi:hypothetical protein [Bacillus sp. REN3]|uniref:hypothetical protein n=1 Tax=Bacillus sp. REN3 TaxID=2802440 RepID=UPI001AEE4D85|nr:hypothetical protein [Bacillus sp. REN3]